MIEHASVGFIQIDTGRVGGITSAKRVADAAQERGIAFVNHTFTSHLALSASLQPYAGIQEDVVCEFPVEAKPLAVEMTATRIECDANGDIQAPEAPGLGIAPDLEAVKKYLVPVEITVRGKRLYQTPSL